MDCKGEAPRPQHVKAPLLLVTSPSPCVQNAPPASSGQVSELRSFGVDQIIFQAVHDERFGAYYRSALYPAWTGACPDPVRVVMTAAATDGVKIWLSSEFVHTDSDGVTDPAVMAGRHAIMSELVELGYTEPSSFYGWYFSSEAYLGPNTTSGCQACFTDDFLRYIETMSGWARQLTPDARKLIAPFGTAYAAGVPGADRRSRTRPVVPAAGAGLDPLVEQLKQLDVDVVAYQDEVGCVRDELPVATSKAAFLALKAAHSSPGTPAIWADLESFTWETVPNQYQGRSALIPAPFPRLLAQLDAVAPLVDRVSTFTVEALYQPPPPNATSGAPAWGPPSAVREWQAYMSALGPSPTIPERLLAVAVHGGPVKHLAIGWRVGFPVKQSQPDPPFAAGRLTDGLTGAQSPYDPRWLGFAPGKDAVVTLEYPATAPWPLHSVAAHFLAVPPLWYYWGNRDQPMPRNVTTWLPAEVQWDAGDGTGPWRPLAGVPATPQWWEREVFDIRTEVLFQVVPPSNDGGRAAPRPRYLRMTAKNAPPPWWASRPNSSYGLQVGRLMIDELIINYQP